MLAADREVVLTLMDPLPVALQAVELAPTLVGVGQHHLRLPERIVLTQERAVERAPGDIGLAAGVEVHPASGGAAGRLRADVLTLLGDAARRAGVVLGTHGQAIFERAARALGREHQGGTAAAGR